MWLVFLRYSADIASITLSLGCYRERDTTDPRSRNKNYDLIKKILEKNKIFFKMIKFSYKIDWGLKLQLYLMK